MADISWWIPSTHLFLLVYHCPRLCRRCSFAYFCPGSYKKNTSTTWKQESDAIIIGIIQWGADDRQTNVPTIFLWNGFSSKMRSPLRNNDWFSAAVATLRLCESRSGRAADTEIFSRLNRELDRQAGERQSETTHSADLNNSTNGAPSTSSR